MSDAQINEKVQWYIVNNLLSHRESAQRIVEKFNHSHTTELELFAPTYVEREERDGEVRYRTANLTFHYAFIHGTLSEVKTFCRESGGKFTFLLDRSSERRYAVMDDRRMTQFKNIAKVYKNRLPCFSIGDIDLEEGDLVEVTSGELAGLIGRFIPKPKSRSGNIVLQVYDKLMTVSYDVKTTDVRVLEFSKNSTRANDQIDAFIPVLFSALRFFYQGLELPDQINSRLTIFGRRLKETKIHNIKLSAKLHILLFATFYIGGEISEANRQLSLYHKEKSAVTNPWTKAICNLILSIIYGSSEKLQELQEHLNTLPPSSKLKRLIADEIDFFLSK